MGTVDVDDRRVLDLINFLEWLDYTREVKASGWGHPDQTHEDTARRYLTT